MNKNNKILITAISGLGMLVVAGVIVTILAVVQHWDILGWFTSPQFFLIAFLVAILAVTCVGYIIYWFTVGRYKK